MDAVLSSAAHHSRSKISNLPQFISMRPKSKKKKTIAINTGIAYKFTELGDNLTNNDTLTSQTRRKIYRA